MSWNVEGVDTLTLRHVRPKLHANFLQTHPKVYALGLTQLDGMSKLGRVNTPAMFGGGWLSQAQVQKRQGDAYVEIRYRKKELTSGFGAVTKDGTMPVASEYGDDQYGHGKIAWAHGAYTIKLRQAAIDRADDAGDLAVENLLRTELDIGLTSINNRVATAIQTDTVTQTQQLDTAEYLWPGLLGINHTFTANNYYGMVDRATETMLNTLAIDAAADLPSAQVSLDLFRYIDTGFKRRTSQEDVLGLRFRSGLRAGVMCHFCNVELFQELRNQAEGRYTVHTQGIPNHPFGGARFPVIEFDGQYIFPDPKVAAGCIEHLNMGTWILELNKNYNFKGSGWHPIHETLVGAGTKREQHYTWEWEWRLSCEDPWLNAKTSNLET